LVRVDIGVRGISLCFLKERRHKIKLSIALGTPLLMAGPLTARADKASAMVVYCRWVDYPANYIVRPGVALRSRQ
jgi:hypothetical protein